MQNVFDMESLEYKHVKDGNMNKANSRYLWGKTIPSPDMDKDPNENSSIAPLSV